MSSNVNLGRAKKMLVGVAVGHFKTVRARRIIKKFRPDAIVLEGQPFEIDPPLYKGSPPRDAQAISVWHYPKLIELRSSGSASLFKTDDDPAIQKDTFSFAFWVPRIYCAGKLIYRGEEIDFNSAINVGIARRIPIYAPEQVIRGLGETEATETLMASQEFRDMDDLEQFQRSLETIDYINLGVPKIHGKSLSFYLPDSSYPFDGFNQNRFMGQFLDYLFSRENYGCIMLIMGTHHFNRAYDDNKGWVPLPPVPPTSPQHVQDFTSAADTVVVIDTNRKFKNKHVIRTG